MEIKKRGHGNEEQLSPVVVVQSPDFMRNPSFSEIQLLRFSIIRVHGAK